jgi:hypothetical protein
MRLGLAYTSFLIGFILLWQGCSKDPIIQPPPVLRVLNVETPGVNASHGAGKMRSESLSRNRQLIEPVFRVSSRLIAAARQSEHAEHGTAVRALSWVIEVYEHETVVRGLVRPEDTLVVCSSTFSIAQTEAGLAALISHELAHAFMHRNGGFAARICGNTEGDTARFTLRQELEADGIGMKLMAEAGYDPTELLLLWERMKQSQFESGDALLVHLTYDRRIDHVRGKLPDALRVYAGTKQAPQRALPVS